MSNFYQHTILGLDFLFRSLRGRSLTMFTIFGFFWPPTPLCLHFLWYKSLQQVVFFTTYPPPPCKRNLWTAPKALVGFKYCLDTQFYYSLYKVICQHKTALSLSVLKCQGKSWFIRESFATYIFVRIFMKHSSFFKNMYLFRIFAAYLNLEALCYVARLNQ